MKKDTEMFCTEVATELAEVPTRHDIEVKALDDNFGVTCSSADFKKVMDVLLNAFTAVWGGPGSFTTRFITTGNPKLADSGDIEVRIIVSLV